jgi:hypothetical protein
MRNDGISWSSHSLGISTTNIFGITYGNQLFVAVGNAGLIYVSAGETASGSWMLRTSGVTSQLNSVAYGNGLFIAVGNAGVVLMGEDSNTWIKQSKTRNIVSITYGKNIFMAVAETGECFRIERISKISLVS